MPEIQPGAEPFLFPGGSTGCLLIHGFTATPQEVRGLGRHLSQLGYSALGVRLSGHGTQIQDLNRSRWQDWMASVEDGYHTLKGICDRIVILGLSTGGALGLLASTFLSTSGVVGMSTLYDLPPDPRLTFLRPILRPLGAVWKSIPKGSRKWFDPEAHLERLAYNAYPLRALHELDLLLTELRRTLPIVSVPVLLIHSEDDPRIPVEHMALIHERLGSIDKTMNTIRDSNHYITCDAQRQKVFEMAADFVQRVMVKPRKA